MSEKYDSMNEENVVQGQIPVGIPCNVPPQNVQYPQQPQYQQQYQQYQVPQQPVYYQEPQQPIQQNVNLPPQLANNQRNHNIYSKPTQMICPCCKQEVVTVVSKEVGDITYIWSFVCCCCCACTVCAPGCLLPFVMDGCLDKNHYCPNCGFNILRKRQECFDFCG